MNRKLHLLLALVMLWTIVRCACAIEPDGSAADGPTADHGAAHVEGHNHPMAALVDTPAEVRVADRRTQEAYQFAYANPIAAREVPCYCGCVGLGHASSYDCYVSGIKDGQPQLEPHALNCTVCVDITQDQMRLMDGNVNVETIRGYLEHNYRAYGPPTPLVAAGETAEGMAEHE